MSFVYHCLTLTLLSIASVLTKELFESPKTLREINGLIAAFADFDFDRLTDVFVITENGRSIELAEGYTSEPYLRLNKKIKCSFDADSGNRIVGVLPADFSGQDFMDVLVVTTDYKKGHRSNKSFKLWLFKGNQTNLECSNTSVPLVADIKSLPLLLGNLV